METRGGLVLVVIMVLMFGALGTLLFELYENTHDECPCEMVKNRECVR